MATATVKTFLPDPNDDTETTPANTLTEAQIVAGSYIVEIELTGDTWIAAGVTGITDAFDGSGDALGTGWTEDCGDWDRVSGVAKSMTAGENIAHHSTAIGVNQYIKLTYITTAADAANAISAVFRVTAAGSPAYAVVCEADTNAPTKWYKLDDLTTPAFSLLGSGQTLGGTLSSGDTIGFTITGTDATTTVRAWRNPTGDAPTSASDWGGAAAATYTDPGAGNYINTGDYVGVHAYLDSVSVDVSMDNFFAGAIPT